MIATLNSAGANDGPLNRGWYGGGRGRLKKTCHFTYISVHHLLRAIIMGNHGSRLLSRSRFIRKKIAISRFTPTKLEKSGKIMNSLST